MKRFLAFILAILVLLTEISWGQIFSQDFNSSSTITDYYNSSPSTNQFRIISTTNSNSNVSVSSNSLMLSKIADVTTQAYAERNYDFATIPSALKVQFDFSVNGGASATSAILMAVGADVSNNATAPTNANIFARIAFNTTANNGEFKIRDITNSLDGANTYSGTRTITWVLNNTGSSQTYTAPDNSAESIANGKADVWVGLTKEFNDLSVQTSSQTLARFKFYTNSWINGTVFTIDNILIQNETALPVELTTFTASNANNGVQLNWETATEVNNYGFNVERAIGNRQEAVGNWEKITFVQGHGNSNAPKSYSFTDEAAPAGKVQYRLKQIDFDGKFEYSNIVEVNVEVPVKLMLYQNSPNPFNPTTEIKFALPKLSNVELSIYNMLGEKVVTLANGLMNAGEHKVAFNASNLSSGVYLYKLTTDNNTSLKKMILMK